jgi:RNA polymerase-interacting CarD/CdnL/TRCF family regulator
MANQGAPEIQIGDGSLHVGDRVVYPNQGICRITGVETKQIAGQSWEVVTLSREEDGATVMVPRAKVMGIGLRKVANVDAIEEVFDYLAAPTDDPQLDWKVRHRENADKMTGGGLFGTAEVLKGLHALSRVRPLPQKERELYDSARHLIVGEIAAAMGIPITIAENNLDYALFPPPGMKRKGKELQPAAIPATGGAVRTAGDDDLGFDDESQEDDGDAASTSAAKVPSGAKASAIDDDDDDGAEAVEPEEEVRPKPAAGKTAAAGRSVGNSKPAPAAKTPGASKPPPALAAAKTPAASKPPPALRAAPPASSPAAPERTQLPAMPARFAQPAAAAPRASHPAGAAESGTARAAPRPANIASPKPAAAKPPVARSAPAPAARKAPPKPASRPAAKAAPKKAAPMAKKLAKRSAKPAPRKSATAARKPAAKSKGKR